MCDHSEQCYSCYCMSIDMFDRDPDKNLLILVTVCECFIVWTTKSNLILNSNRQSKMCSEQQRELYSQFEPDANEAVFGQRTAPDRPLTDKEVSQRKRIILKLVDQKLKFDLIALMRQQQEQSDGSRACKIQISGPDLLNESNGNPSSIGGVCQIDTWSMESNFYAPQSFNQQLPTYQSLSYPSQHTVTQRFEFHNPTSYQFSRPTFQYLKPNRMRMAQSANVRPQREKSNPNLIQLPVVPKEIPATVTSDEVIVPKPSETVSKILHNFSTSPEW